MRHLLGVGGAGSGHEGRDGGVAGLGVARQRRGAGRLVEELVELADRLVGGLGVTGVGEADVGDRGVLDQVAELGGGQSPEATAYPPGKETTFESAPLVGCEGAEPAGREVGRAEKASMTPSKISPRSSSSRCFSANL